MRLLFCLTVAILAASVADPLLELVSNLGLFGPGHFTDRSNLDVLPALVTCSLFAFALVFIRARATLLSQSLRAARDSIAPSTVLRMLPAIFIAQIAVLYGMETLEQVIVYGHVLAPWLWLGGPAAVSICVHAMFCVFACFTVARAVRALAQAAVHIVCIILPCASRIARIAASFVASFDSFVAPHKPAPVSCRIGKRGPPLLIR